MLEGPIPFTPIPDVSASTLSCYRYKAAKGDHFLKLFAWLRLDTNYESMFYSIYLTSNLYKQRGGKKLVANAPLAVGETVVVCGNDIESSGWRQAYLPLHCRDAQPAGAVSSAGVSGMPMGTESGPSYDAAQASRTGSLGHTLLQPRGTGTVASLLSRRADERVATAAGSGARVMELAPPPPPQCELPCALRPALSTAGDVRSACCLAFAVQLRVQGRTQAAETIDHVCPFLLLRPSQSTCRRAGRTACGTSTATCPTATRTCWLPRATRPKTPTRCPRWGHWETRGSCGS